MPAVLALAFSLLTLALMRRALARRHLPARVAAERRSTPVRRG